MIASLRDGLEMFHQLPSRRDELTLIHAGRDLTDLERAAILGLRALDELRALYSETDMRVREAKATADYRTLHEALGVSIRTTTQEPTDV